MNQLNIQSQDNKTLVLTLLDTAKRLERRLDGNLSNIRGISFSEYHLLLKLSEMHERTAMRVDLATAVGLTPSAVTRALKPLEKLGYIATRKNDRDARRSLAELTPAGLELLADAEGVVNDVIASLPLESTDHKELVRMLQALINQR